MAICPAPRAIMVLMTGSSALMTPVTLTVSESFAFARSYLEADIGCQTPALNTAKSIGPRSDTICDAQAATAFSSVTSSAYGLMFL